MLKHELGANLEWARINFSYLVVDIVNEYNKTCTKGPKNLHFLSQWGFLFILLLYASTIFPVYYVCEGKY